MFDTKTARLIRAAPQLRNVNPDTLPQELTAMFAELVMLRLRANELESVPERLRLLERLSRVASIYEAIVDTGSVGDARRAAAFVAATAHQMLGKVMAGAYATNLPYLSAQAVHPLLAAPLLFLIAEQNADAREAAKAIANVGDANTLKSALIETVHDLAAERFEEILARANRLRRIQASDDLPPEAAIEQALYGLCWAGIVRMVSDLLGQEAPPLQFIDFASPRLAFEKVIELAVDEVDVPIEGGHLVSLFAGPRHLARLLHRVADGLDGAGLIGLEPLDGMNENFWKGWLRHRAKTKPILWRNHREALATGFLERGRSGVLILPTGAGKTTLSELKIAATLANQKKVIFLVPTLALVDQLRDELVDSFPATIGNVQVAADGDLMGLVLNSQLQSIEVMTPERCLALMSHAPDAVEDVGLIVFDECHLLSPHGGGTRSLDAMLCLVHALKRAPDADFLLLSAMLTNGQELAERIQEITHRPCVAFQDTWKPSRQARGIVIYPREELQAISQSARRQAKGVNCEVSPFALFGLHQNWNMEVQADTKLVRLSETSVKLALNQQRRPTPNANSVAGELAVFAAEAGLKTIIFVQQANHAPSTAKKIAAKLDAIEPLNPLEESLWAGVTAELGGEQFSLVSPTAAALPHNGDMIPLERRLAESLFKKHAGATVIVATPTLAQGMNLPAQLAILAGDKRHGDGGRSPLAAHEILNAAGRAGRAGHLANGIVLMIPEPLAAFSTAGVPEGEAFEKLLSVLPTNDQCVLLEDPVTAVLDRVQAGNFADATVRYFISRIQASENPEEAVQTVLAMVRKSFAEFHARKANEEALFDQEIESLRAMHAADNPADPNVTSVAASNGLAIEPLLAIQVRLQANIATLPTTIVGWSDWLVDFFREDNASYSTLIGNEAKTAMYVMRGSQKGGALTEAEFLRLKESLRLWLRGRPFCEIEVALGATDQQIKHCPRARDLVLKLANRSFYLILSAVVELAKLAYSQQDLPIPQPAVLETLAVAFRKGIDKPEKVAFENLNKNFRSRVLMHTAFENSMGALEGLEGQSYQDVLNYMTARLAFANVQLP